MKKISQIGIVVMLILVHTSLVFANGSSEDKNTSSSTPTVVNLYTSESQDKVNEMMNEFTKKNPDITVNIFRSGTGAVVSKIEAELESGETLADVIWFADVDYFSKLDKKNLLLEYDSPEAKDLDPRYKYNNGKFYEVRQIFNILAYNTLKVSDPLVSWHDLYRPDLRGKTAIANPNYSGAAFLTLSQLVDNKGLGWDYYKSLKKNDCKFELSNGKLTSKVSNGEYWAISVVDFMVRNAENEGSPVKSTWPSEGAALIPTPVGIIATSKVQDSAKKIIDFLLTDECQKLFVKQGYIPVKSNVGVPEGAPSLDDIKLLDLNLEFLSNNRTYLREEFSNIFELK